VSTQVRPAPARKRDKRGAIIEAAQFLFLRQGFAGTTMEAIAREAHVAKPTLYAHFPDKDAVFDGVASNMLAAMRQLVVETMETDGPAAQVIARALAAKYGMMNSVLFQSPFAEELMGEQSRRSGSQVAGLEGEIEAMFTARLASEGYDQPGLLARTAIGAAGGIASRFGVSPEASDAIQLGVERILVRDGAP
jgi:AcrR family transcriptional regulator